MFHCGCFGGDAGKDDVDAELGVTIDEASEVSKGGVATTAYGLFPVHGRERFRGQRSMLKARQFQILMDVELQAAVAATICRLCSEPVRPSDSVSHVREEWSHQRGEAFTFLPEQFYAKMLAALDHNDASGAHSPPRATRLARQLRLVER